MEAWSWESWDCWGFPLWKQSAFGAVQSHLFLSCQRKPAVDTGLRFVVRESLHSYFIILSHTHSPFWVAQVSQNEPFSAQGSLRLRSASHPAQWGALHQTPQHTPPAGTHHHHHPVAPGARTPPKNLQDEKCHLTKKSMSVHGWRCWCCCPKRLYLSGLCVVIHLRSGTYPTATSCRPCRRCLSPPLPAPVAPS